MLGVLCARQCGLQQQLLCLRRAVLAARGLQLLRARLLRAEHVLALAALRADGKGALALVERLCCSQLEHCAHGRRA